ncbi:thiopurine S-methyltransferase [Marinobacterium weihaiense]|uniref:Thiopurine S-methyltransferase n=1 Tax=Marinobacterium weihaiense TaxID=2851016 RepID=A0ABS6MDR8_9GAMM|nr:thiopurine S-methyltransferase [Marinobacterium weihaiense]MBV0933872.1 thiopurine S-methyltransferase [Marinobacterium weihaiense]
MEHAFWHTRWKEGRIGFHQTDINAWLCRYWPRLRLPAGARVLVPLCGKSRDMLWLREQGHEVVGVELSDLACRDFFEEQGVRVTPVAVPEGHTRTRDGITLWSADLFALGREHWGEVAAVYDRAALIALPPAMRKAYAAHLREQLPAGVEMLLVTLELTGSEGPPFSVPEAEVRRLFEPAFTLVRLDQAEVESGRREVVYRLTRQ